MLILELFLCRYMPERNVSPLHLQKRVQWVHFPITSCTKDHPWQKHTKTVSSVVGLYSHELSRQSGCFCHTFFIRPLQVLVVMSHTIFDKETPSWICTYFFLIYGRISGHLAHLRPIASQVSHNQSGAKVAHFVYVSLILINCKSLQRIVQPPWNSKQAWILWVLRGHGQRSFGFFWWISWQRRVWTKQK